MTQLTLNTSVGQWVARHPQTARILNPFKLTFAAEGTSLEQACRDRALNPQDVAEALQQALNKAENVPSEDWLDASLTDLCDHIEKTHHAYLRLKLPRLTERIAKVVIAHGNAHPELLTVQQAFAELRAELEPHMFKEERILFPAIRLLEQADAKPSFPFGTVANPIRVMEHEHDNAGEALSQIRELTDGYRVPSGACNTYRAMLEELRELETDLHQHIHKENNILFPRAVQLDEARVLP